MLVSVDPVCGMRVDEGSAAARLHHGGEEYLFCSAHCAEKFRKDPARFAKAAAFGSESVKAVTASDHGMPTQNA